MNEHEAELLSSLVAEMGPLQESEGPLDPMVYCEDCNNKLEQDLMTFPEGILARHFHRRMRQYQADMTEPRTPTTSRGLEIQGFGQSCSHNVSWASYICTRRHHLRRQVVSTSHDFQ